MALPIGAALVALALFASWPWLDPRYLPESQLARKPNPMSNVVVEYPHTASGVDYVGQIRMRLYIDREGAVQRVEVERADVPASFVEAAVKAFRETRWEPGRKWGRRVKTLKVIAIDFQPPPGAGLTPPAT